MPGAVAQPVNLSPELEAVTGPGPMPRGQVTKAVWDYIKSNGLQDANDGRVINPDEKLGKILGSEPINMLQMTGKLQPHMTKIEGAASNVTPMPTQEDDSMPMAA